MGVVSELKRRNVLRMLVLYMVAAWLIMQVAEVVIALANLPDWIGPGILGLLAIGFPIALTCSWFYELTPEGMKLEKDVDPAESITHVTGRRLDFLVISLLCAAVILFAVDKWWASEPPEKSVAVLPFTNMSDDPDNEYLSDGLTETLLHALAQLPDLKVSARTSSFFFKGQDMDVREVAAQLGVSNVLEGSVQRDGDKLRIIAQLIEAETGFHLWSKTYDRNMSNIFEVQDEIATSVALAMKVTLSGDTRQGVSKIKTVGTDDVAAYEKYLQGLQQKNIGGAASIMQAEILFKSALVLRRDFYEAKLELARTYRSQQAGGAITIAEVIKRFGPLVEQLLEERPDDDSVLLLAADLQYYRSITQGDVTYDVEKHLAELTAAVERTPNEAGLYSKLFRLLWDFTDRHEEAIKWLDRGIAVDPLDSLLHFRRGHILRQFNDLEGAEASYTRAIELGMDKASGYAFVADIAWQRKQYAQWFALMRKSMEGDLLDHEVPAFIAEDLFVLGLMEEGGRYLQRALDFAPDKAFVQSVKMYQLFALDDHAGARDMSATILRNDIDNRYDTYWHAAMMFMSTMSASERAVEALAVLEELLPGVSSPDFHARTPKEHALQYHAILGLITSQSNDETRKMLDAVVLRWDESIPTWRDIPGAMAPIAMARGQTEVAVELTLQELERAFSTLVRFSPVVRFRHFDYYNALTLQPAVAERLKEIDAELKQAGEEIRAYILENDLQL